MQVQQVQRYKITLSSSGGSFYLTRSEHDEFMRYYEKLVRPGIEEEAKKKYAPQMEHIALAAAIGFSRKDKQAFPKEDIEEDDFLDTLEEEDDEWYKEGIEDDDIER